MFSFDTSALPQLTTRRALICVDLQCGFTSLDGGLPVTKPEGYVQRVLELAAAFRDTGGEVIWVKSRWEACRLTDCEQIIISDDRSPSQSTTAVGSNRRCRRRIPVVPPLETKEEASKSNVVIDAEAFLSHQKAPICLEGVGSDWTPAIEKDMAKSDLKLTKTNYSAFKGTQLLHALRARMVMEVFICGSLANIGVYATAMDAAGHGLSISIVEDCCGYREDLRKSRAVTGLISFTGCEVSAAEDVLQMVKPRCEDVNRVQKTGDDSLTLASSMEKLHLEPDMSLAVEPKKPEDAQECRAKPNTVEILTTKSKRQTEPEPKVEFNKSGTKVEPESTAQSTTMPNLLGDSLPKQEATSRLPEYTDSDLRELERSQGSEATTKEDGENPIFHLFADMSKISIKDEPKDSQPDLKNSGDTPEGTRRGLCEGDTDIFDNVLPSDLEDGIFEKLKDEISWQRMSHQGGEVPRLVAVQGQISDDGSLPVYRHPADESPPLQPFSTTVLAIKEATEAYLGHSLNHVLIQLYRDGKDYISEHSDKTLDIVPTSFIANISLGAQRTMMFRTKRKDKDLSTCANDINSPSKGSAQRRSQRATLTHNSLCRMGLKTNMKWLHAIRQDKRADRDKSPAELAYRGARISLTFRQIGTFLSKDQTLIWGQGATGKSRQDAHEVINGTGPEVVAMLKAFGTENHSSYFDWDQNYGKGFDVLHMSSSPRFFSSNNTIVNMRIELTLAEFGIKYTKGSMGGSEKDQDADTDDVPIKYMDNDTNKSEIKGDVATLMYLDAIYGAQSNKCLGSYHSILAKRFTRFNEALVLSKTLLQPGKKSSDSSNENPEGKPTKFANTVSKLRAWDKYLEESGDDFFAGESPSLPDFVLWPLLYHLVNMQGASLMNDLNHLKNYYDKFGNRDSVKGIIGSATGKKGDTM